MNIASLTPFAPIIQATATLVVGAAVSYVAWRQWQTAKEKLALDLFDKRFSVYEVIAQHLYGAGSFLDLRPTKADVQKAFRSSRFLFGDEVYNELSVIFFRQATDMVETDFTDADVTIAFSKAHEEMLKYMRFDRPMRR